MNLFWKKLFGKMQSTHSIEKEEEELREATKRYNDVRDSDVLKRYLELKKIISSPPFRAKKTEYSTGNIRKMIHFTEWERYCQFEKDQNLKHYFEVEEMPLLHEYLSFKETPNYRLLSDADEIAKSETLKQYLAFEQSKEYRVYLNYHNSFTAKEYLRVKEIVSSPEFIAEKAFWEDAHRWEKTNEYVLEKEYTELKNREDVKFYEKSESQLAQRQSGWRLTFEEDFRDGVLDTRKWYPALYQGQQLMEKTYSFANEKQANNGGNNLVMIGGQLTIATRKDQVEARAWTPSKGFAEKTFQFTSDVINGSNAIKINRGLIKAKVKIAGEKSISHAFWITGKKQAPHINLFYFDGQKIQVGNYWDERGVLGSKSETITGISPTDFYIYSLEWTPTELIWRINNVEVLRTAKGVPNEDLFPVFNSFISEKQKGGNGEFIIDWLKVYERN